jgi:hypothetical protein
MKKESIKHILSLTNFLNKSEIEISYQPFIFKDETEDIHFGIDRILVYNGYEFESEEMIIDKLEHKHGLIEILIKKLNKKDFIYLIRDELSKQTVNIITKINTSSLSTVINKNTFESLKINDINKIKEIKTLYKNYIINEKKDIEYRHLYTSNLIDTTQITKRISKIKSKLLDLIKQQLILIEKEEYTNVETFTIKSQFKNKYVSICKDISDVLVKNGSITQDEVPLFLKLLSREKKQIDIDDTITWRSSKNKLLVLYKSVLPKFFEMPSNCGKIFEMLFRDSYGKAYTKFSSSSPGTNSKNNLEEYNFLKTKYNVEF